MRSSKRFNNGGNVYSPHTESLQFINWILMSRLLIISIPFDYVLLCFTRFACIKTFIGSSSHCPTSTVNIYYKFKIKLYLKYFILFESLRTYFLRQSLKGYNRSNRNGSRQRTRFYYQW